MKISDLVPGDRVVIHGMGSAIFIGIITPHPLYVNKGLSLVIWKMGDGSWSMDALLARMELPGDVDTSNRSGNLHTALLGKL